MNLWNWDPFGLLGTPQGTGTLGAGFLGGPLGFLGSLFGSQFEGGGTAGQATPESSGTTPTQNIIAQIMPLLMMGLVIFLAVKFLPKLIK